MRQMFFLLILFSFNFLHAQQYVFPGSWEGKWQGDMQWHQTGKDTAVIVKMKLNIEKTDSAGVWNWQLVYGADETDSRPYKLIQKDEKGIHWVIDELSGIVLDQYRVAGKLCGVFTVMNSTILNSYWMEGDHLIVEFYSIGCKPISTTGKGNDEIPFVDSYRVGSYQKAVLTRVK
ncbi:MAG: hypothetical protein BWZ05_01081 [Bacteroidetes bacterium ADurb.BinA245]|jgi:hypothetical protein|nr:MAG: hypothetical protein BWZ05_01081 [Bacteroidetes bacterium ADurb.BinA245]HND95809.1 hypothetical protein [Chitinophagaceae bacterium]HNF37436.1 hypothetical protein [Chitinophagaceae bacterium]HNJ26278.1 hypothetical protein [Chitinophagaceae bacterium]HNJ55957.1 hypothetical protein [Chitinophagaceae bacterium]